MGDGDDGDLENLSYAFITTCIDSGPPCLFFFYFHSLVRGGSQNCLFFLIRLLPPLGITSALHVFAVSKIGAARAAALGHPKNKAYGLAFTAVEPKLCNEPPLHTKQASSLPFSL